MIARQQLVPSKVGLVPTTGGVELAHYRTFDKYAPKIGDFVIWHGWWSRWYGIVSNIDGDELSVITESLPKLLFTTPPNRFKEHTVKVSTVAIRSSQAGEYHILQDGVWYID